MATHNRRSRQDKLRRSSNNRLEVLSDTADAVDEQRALRDDNKLAQDAEDIANELAGVDPGVVELLAAPPTADELEELPSIQPHDREIFVSWVGRTDLGELLDDADRLMGGKRTWLALARLERPREREPTASLLTSIEQHDGALDVLRRIVDTAAPSDVLASDDGRTFPLAHAALGIAFHVGRRRNALQHQLRARETYNERVDDISHDPRGARGFYSGNTVHRRFLAVVKPLTDAGWNRPQLAKLVLESRRWRKPPCPRYVDALLDDAGGERRRAVTIFAQRLHDANRRG